jgi:hypothetical protein
MHVYKIDVPHLHLNAWLFGSGECKATGNTKAQKEFEKRACKKTM